MPEHSVFLKKANPQRKLVNQRINFCDINRTQVIVLGKYPAQTHASHPVPPTGGE